MDDTPQPPLPGVDRRARRRNRLGRSVLRFRWRKLSGYMGRRVLGRQGGIAIVEYEVPAPPPMSGGRLAFLSDTHFDDSRVFIGPLLAKAVNGLAPDWIVFGGDLLTYTCRFQEAADFLASMKAAAAKIAVLGNWDIKRRKWMPVKLWREMYAAAGFNLLVNEYLDLPPVRFAGAGVDARLSSFWLSRNTPAFVCLACHKPDTAVELLGAGGRGGGINLALCGHTHGGQIRIPLFGAIRTQSAYWKKFEYGLYEHTRSAARLIVSSGIGTSGIRMRLFCEPEIVIVRFL